MVNFNKLYNKKSSSSCLTYSYLWYNSIFIKLLLHYIEKLKMLDGKLLNVNNMLFVIDKLLLNYNTIDDYSDFPNWNLNYVYKDNLFKLNLVEIISVFTNNEPTYASSEEILYILDALHKGYNAELVDFLTKNSNILDLYKKEIITLNKKKNYNNNIIFSFFFLVKDLEGLRDNLKALKKVDSNGGPQRKRGMCNLTDFNVLNVDNGFRRSLFLNSTLFNSRLTERDFSIKNIHINLGKIRWHSTIYKNSLNKDSNKKDVLVTDRQNYKKKRCVFGIFWIW